MGNYASRALPSPVADGGSPQDWTDRYGTRIVMPWTNKSYGAADAGKYFIVRNPTPGTGIASAAAPTTLDDTKPFFILANGDTPSSPSAKRLYLDYLKLQVTAAGTGGTNINASSKIDSNSTSRYTSGGSALTPKNVNMDSGEASIASAYAGAITAAAASANARLLFQQLIRNVIPVVGDTYLINFAPLDPNISSMAVAGTAIASLVFPHPPVVLGPQQAFLLHLWLASQSGASSYEIECGYWER